LARHWLRAEKAFGEVLEVFSPKGLQTEIHRAIITGCAANNTAEQLPAAVGHRKVEFFKN
jgi:hypothetical protein